MEQQQSEVIAPQPRRIRVIDLSKCIGCGACEAACEALYGMPFIKVYRVGASIYIPISCMHCQKAPCVAVCPTKAMHVGSDGFIYVDKAKCIGCLACLEACPFGIPELEPKLRVVTKCDLCRDLRAKGLDPACSAICPTGALVYGLEDRVFSEVKRRVAEYIAKAQKETPYYLRK
ncbi:MAG: 4Fe-4S dicluster domain-containing protein [Desulfurococcaceae archaeon]